MESAQKLDCKDLHGYVLTLPPAVLEQLYGHPATCLAIFRFVTLLHWVLSPVVKAGTWVALQSKTGRDRSRELRL